MSAWRKYCPSASGRPLPADVAKSVHDIALHDIKAANRHLNDGNSVELYRILFYDCPPFSEGKLNPLTNEFTDFKKTDIAKFRNELHEELKRRRKVALRFGRLATKPDWIISPEKTKQILKTPDKKVEITDRDIRLDIRQKGVDMKIGLDIASLALKQMVDQIILISGDSDFVPAAKLARREGIDFMLDCMGNHINTDLHEHIDGLLKTTPRFGP